MKYTPVFKCKKCSHNLYLEGKLKKLMNYDCPLCGEEGYELWVFSHLANKKEVDETFNK